MNNKGSSVVEISLIMPVILGVVVLILFLFIDTAEDGLVQQDGYCSIYTYCGSDSGNEIIAWAEMNSEAEEGTFSLSGDSCRYENGGHIFITETDVCSDRLRRWQVYGNIIRE